MEFNIDPYYDDFKENALDNNYMKILFKPGRAVQARELTQIQSILQNQIKAFGDHVFQDGSPVIGGNMTLDNTCKWVKLEKTYNTVDVDVADFENRVIVNTSGNVQAKVLATYYPLEGDPTLMVRYMTGNEFGFADTVRVAGETTEARTLSTNTSGLGTVVSINEGVFYADGYFVKVLDQTAVVNAYSSSANVKIGLEINEEIVDSEIDTTLLDPAQSSFNYQAPGADRYQFSLVLTTRPLDTVVDESKFFELMRVENGLITKQVKYPVYAELEKTLARRTYDESGDYTVKPFRASIVNGLDDDQYTIAIEPGKAYVKGFEFETLGTMKVNVDKPRSAADVKSLSEVDVDISYGNYVFVTGLRGNTVTSVGFPNFLASEKVDLHCVDTSSVNIGLGYNANTQTYQNTKIGSAEIRNFVRYSAASNTQFDSNGAFKLYLSNISLEPIVAKVGGASDNAKSITFSDKFSQKSSAYVNATVTILPVSLTAIGNVSKANVYKGGYTVNANSATANVFASPNIAIGDVVRIGDDVREVVSIDDPNNRFTVNTEFSQTIIGTGTAAPLQIFRQNTYSSNVVNQSRTIMHYDGSTKKATLDREFDDGAKIGGAVANAATVVQLNFKIDQLESVISGNVTSNIADVKPNVSMNVSGYSKYLTGETSFEDTQKKALVFRLPRTYAKRSTLQNVDYVHNKIILGRSNNSTVGEFTISQGNGLESYESIPWAQSTGSVQDNLIVVVRNNGGNTIYSNGEVIQLTASNVEVSSSSLKVKTNIADITAVDIIVSVKVNDAEDRIRTKNFYSNTDYSGTSSNFTYPVAENGTVTVTVSNFGTVANINTAQGLVFLGNTQFNTVRPGDSISLFVPDVVKINKILAGNTTHYPDATNVRDITNNFYVDYGQRDDRYDHAKIILKDGYDSPIAKLLVHVDYYEHIYSEVSDKTTFFSVDSYPQSHYTNGIIPIYTSSTGTVYNLRDCLDFRATQTLGDGSGGYTIPKIPSPDETSELSYDYYLPRIDKLVLSKDKEFRVIKGKAAAQPLPPADTDDSMTLYTMYLPPYVADVREVRMKYRENRRYTMRDIASIDKRLERVEFFTSLNNVEKLAMADKTQYEDGTEKEKYGIVGENFTNFNIVDYKSPDFNVALENGFMIPAMKVFSLGLKTIDRENTALNRKTVCLNYSEEPAIVQSLASDKAVSVQPFLFGQFNGSIVLTPETDTWVSETLKPEVITVPEKIIEKETVIREKVIEPPAPPTLPPPTGNSDVIIITNPFLPPPPTSNDDIIIIAPEDPFRPIIDDGRDRKPANEDLNILPSYPEFGGFEFDPWFRISPINFGVNFTFGATGFSAGNLFSNGGLFNESYWAPAPIEPEITIIQPEPNYESSVPTVLPPLNLDSAATLDSGGGGGKAVLERYDYDKE